VRVAESHQFVYDALAQVNDPELRRPITELGMVDSVTVDDDTITATVLLTIVGCPAADLIERSVRDAIEAVAGPRRVELTLGVMSPQQRTDLISTLTAGKSGGNPFTKDSLTRVIAVTSGKGGVGKSTVTANLAAATAAAGYRVGLIDADVFGFSIPGLLGIEGIKPTKIDNLMLPPVAHDVKVISIGMFVASDQAVAWRGPLLHRTIEQFLTDVHFGDLDFLFLDLPPGTGDIALSVGQLLPQAEVVVVTTPQPAAADVAWRSAEVAKQTGQKVLGVIENMSATTLGDGTVLDVFGSGGGDATARRLGVPLLGTVPLSSSLRKAGDDGLPIVLAGTGDSPEQDPAAQVLREIAASIITGGESLVGKKLPVVSA
jgi:ATP-binding protein involved in chromosome partitioning